MSQKSDIWMFGCIMFFVFFEIEPWKPHKLDEVKKLIKERKDIFENTAINEDKKILVPPAIKEYLKELL